MRLARARVAHQQNPNGGLERAARVLSLGHQPQERLDHVCAQHLHSPNLANNCRKADIAATLQCLVRSPRLWCPHGRSTHRCWDHLLAGIREILPNDARLNPRCTRRGRTVDG